MVDLKLRKRRLYKVLVLTCILTLNLISLYLLKIYEWGTFCLFREITSLNCPACGSTRMVISLLNGQVYQGFRYNPFMFISIPYIIVMYICCAISYVLNGELTRNICRSLLVYAMLLILFGVIRNVPMFSSLAPTDIKL